MFVSSADLEAFTGLRRSHAQARFLEERGIKFVRRGDGSIALRQAELDRHTLSKPWEQAKQPTASEPQLVLDPEQQCVAQVDGRQCKHRAQPGTDLCWTHTPPDEVELAQLLGRGSGRQEAKR